MRMTQLFVQTLRDTPTEAATPGYQFLLRAGFIRPLFPGSYSFLPLGRQAREKIEELVRKAIHAIGGQEMALPLIQPVDLIQDTDGWKLSGKVEASVARFRGRDQREVVFGLSHEEAIVTAARNVIQSYRQLPMLLYHVWQSFRDEGRTWGGLFGAREMLVMDGFSLHPDGADLEGFYPRVHEALAGILAWCGLPMLSVTTEMVAGSTAAHRIVWPSKLGEETAVVCDACGYSVDQTIAQAGKLSPPAEDLLPMEDVETPDCKTIADLARFLDIPESRTAKALFLVAYIAGKGDRFVFAIVRGDTDLNEAKLKQVLNAETVGPATEAEIRSVGAEPGYGSPIGLEGVIVVVDDLIPQSPNLVAGANRPGYHTRNVNHGRDYQASVVADITLAQSGDPCPECGAPLRVVQGIEMAALAKIGDSYSQALDATYLDRGGQAQPMVMGRYRLYCDRLLAAVAEAHHDEQGFIWPIAVAPYDVYLMTLGKRSGTVDEAANRLYADLEIAGLNVLFDDRDERAGVKFNDADLLGMPLRVVVGERGLKTGKVEVKLRNATEVEAVSLEDLVSRVTDILYA